jgi:hypothetical protein
MASTLKETNLGIAFQTNRTIQKVLKRKLVAPNRRTLGEKKKNILTAVYVGQTERNFKTGFQEHIRHILATGKIKICRLCTK